LAYARIAVESVASTDAGDGVSAIRRAQVGHALARVLTEVLDADVDVHGAGDIPLLEVAATRSAALRVSRPF
jgi:hypothetical protein